MQAYATAGRGRGRSLRPVTWDYGGEDPLADSRGFRLERVSGKTLRSGTKVTVTFTAADGSGKNCKVTVKMP